MLGYRRVCALFYLLALSISPSTWSQVLQVELTGLEGDLRDNTLIWLGSPPDSPQARANYLYAARERVENSLQALGYYRPDIRLNLDRTAQPWRLDIEVDPGERVHLREVNVQFIGDALVDPAFLDLLAAPGLAPGDPLNHEVYESFKRRVSSLGERRGYFDGRFTLSRIEVEPIGATADVQLVYDSGRRYAFGKLRVDQTYLREDLLQPLLAMEPGAAYDQALLQKTQASLQRTGYFSTVILRPQPQQAEAGRVPLDMELFPSRRHSFDVGIGYSTDTEDRVSLTWRTPRINRHGHSQETRLQYSSVNPSGRINYFIPLEHPLNDLLQLGVRVEDNEFGDLDSHQKELSVRREIKRDQWIYGYGLRGLNESWSSRGLRRQNDYLLPGFSISRRTRTGSLVNPRQGFSQWYRTEAAHTSLGSEIDMLRALATFGYITSFGQRHRMVFRSDIGAAFLSDGDRDDLAPSLSFFAGGSQSIRGFGYQSLGEEVEVVDDAGETRVLVVGGDRLLTASAEYQYTFTESWRGALFADGGDAFDEGNFELNVGLGFGIHYVTQVGAIRLELANPVTKSNPAWRVHLAVGAEF